jgi:hypothetical protein
MQCSKWQPIRSPRWPGKEGRWYIDAKRLRSLEIDNDLDLGRLLNRKVGYLLAS